jgi:hypothetical protein
MPSKKIVLNRRKKIEMEQAVGRGIPESQETFRQVTDALSGLVFKRPE